MAISGKGAMILGGSGIGKSDLALRLIDAGAALVADDRLWIDCRLNASCPPEIAGLLEVRGIGLLHFPHLAAVPLALAIFLVPGSEKIERLPEPEFWHHPASEKLRLPAIKLHGFESSAVARIHASMRHYSQEARAGLSR